MTLHELFVFMVSGPSGLRLERNTQALENQELTVDERVTLLIERARLAKKVWIAGEQTQQYIFRESLRVALQAQPKVFVSFAIARAQFYLGRGERFWAKCDFLGARRVCEDYSLPQISEIDKELAKLKDVQSIIRFDFPYPAQS